MSDERAAPLVHEVVVEAAQAHAFDTWVKRAGTWWPRAHTLTGDPKEILFEPRVGGQVLERGRDGQEHPWGEVLVWEPPERVELRWHHVFPASEATQLAISFLPAAEGTVVRIEQSGWESLGSSGPPRRQRTVQGWANVGEAFAHFVTVSGSGPRGTDGPGSG